MVAEVDNERGIELSTTLTVVSSAWVSLNPSVITPLSLVTKV